MEDEEDSLQAIFDRVQIGADELLAMTEEQVKVRFPMVQGWPSPELHLWRYFKACDFWAGLRGVYTESPGLTPSNLTA